MHPFIVNKNHSEYRKLKKRNRKEAFFKNYGKIAIFGAILFLVFLFSSIFNKGYSAFFQTQIKLNFDLKGINNLEQISHRKIIIDSLQKRFANTEKKDRRALMSLISRAAPYILRDKLSEENLNRENYFFLPTSSEVDMFFKGKKTNIDPKKREWLEELKENDELDLKFNLFFFKNADSRNAEIAGIFGSVAGSFFTILVCMVIALPIGVAAAIYLEEFAKKNRLSTFIEVSINNLAAVPSIVYGLLGLAVFLNFFALPRSSSLVGGLCLSLLILPTIIIATRNSLRSVPPSIKQAAIGLGASKMQVLFHHTLPLSASGIMTGTILSIARALGETAPLIMIGMVAFVASVPGDIYSSATSLPVQIYLWSDSPEAGFAEKTSAAIIVLLLFLMLMNSIAIFIRRRFKQKW